MSFVMPWRAAGTDFGFSRYNPWRRVVFPRGILFQVLRRPSAGGLNGTEVRQPKLAMPRLPPQR